MLPLEHPDRIQIAFDDHRLVNNAGLLLPATLAQHVGLRELVDRHLDLGDAPGRANAGDKMLTLVASALAGGDCIDDADALRAGRTSSVLGCMVKAPSTLGTFLRSFRWGHVRQLDRVSRELLARAWAAGAGPGDAPLTIDLDSTICETYGLAKEGARHHGYTGKRGYHPLLAVAAGTGVLRASHGAMAPTPELNRIVKRLGNHRLSQPQLRQLANLELEPVDEGPVQSASSSAETALPTRRELTPRQLALWKAVQHARIQGLPLREIARQFGISRNTVRKYARALTQPTNRPHNHGSGPLSQFITKRSD